MERCRRRARASVNAPAAKVAGSTTHSRSRVPWAGKLRVTPDSRPRVPWAGKLRVTPDSRRLSGHLPVKTAAAPEAPLP